ncbi:CcoQ/FixQ family Cbb3-type cytochrome c oxidase assembly chaperone [Flavipsychrobacter stenotrophus]|uniref:CcoQ/FixQ family Cbb3-type cytochrome c oxidase assembly chaperone n=1 Tax=Flavipsychrobacter stenotrophus TaxID=2077091 RepID=A0A2S7SZ09_9BACT|nr:CcoQ/FixQ family Cbb3-type cytochrome c oxidase assembly chaperone [Flavipsychrobacter stenotrophus]PQJ11815.1 CcoQ/FixQ family Cbb3-type cytochrome c oxidase assembly chaperone [Flavipsychrobacter stenotrophus]
MKFIHYLEHITGVGIYPLTSLTIFFVFFAAMATWSARADKKYIEELKNIPFPEKNNQ